MRVDFVKVLVEIRESSDTDMFEFFFYRKEEKKKSIFEFANILI